MPTPTTPATAPAQRVEVTNQLPTNLDWNSLEFTEFGFGDTIVPVPTGRTQFFITVGLTYNNKFFNVEVELSFDTGTGIVRAVFQSLDPATALPPEVLTGFLPPEDGTGIGQAHVSYSVMPKANLASGTELRNVALIRFDGQSFIATNQIDPQNAAAGTSPAKEALNTIDAGLPSSSVAPLPAIRPGSFMVDWSGSDDASGIAGYNVYVSDNAGPFAVWQTNTVQTAATFTGQDGHSYAFYSTATDNVGHIEAVPTTADTSTTVHINRAPSVANAGNVTVNEGASATNTGTWSDLELDVVTLTASVGAITKNANGTWSWSFNTNDGPDQSQTVTITATDSNAAVTTTSFALVVNNVAPNVAVNNASITVDKGQTANNTGTWSDPGLDVVTLSASVGAITKNVNGTWSWSFNTNNGPAQSQTVTISATDSDGAVTATTFALIVNNVDIGFTIVESGGSTSVVENGVAANKTDSFTLVLKSQPATNVVLTVVSGDTTEATVSPASLTFTPANWNVPRTVTATGVFDNIADGNQNSLVTVAVDDLMSDDAFDPVLDQIVSVAVIDTPNTPTITSVSGITTATPTFNFSDVVGESNYSIVIIDIDSIPAVEVFRNGAIPANSTTYTVPGSANLQAGRSYRAFMFATTATSYSLSGGITGPANQFTQFTVGTAPTAPPAAPTSTGTTGIANRPTIHWPASPTATSYAVYLINFGTNTLVESKDGITTDSFTPANSLADGVYRIFVRAVNSIGSSAFGAPFNFSIGSAPTSVPTAPVATGASGAANQPTINWPASPTATSYAVYLINLGTNTLVESKVGVPTNSFTPINSLANGRYRIFIRAINIVGSSAFGAPFDFTIGAAIVAPIVPTGLTAINKTTPFPTLQWNAVAGATSYSIWFVKLNSTGPATLISGATGLMTNSYTHPTPLANGNYRFLVLAKNSVGSSLYSSVYDFPVNAISV